MRVIITNNGLAVRGGVETFQKLLARSLESRGHQVLAYSSALPEQPRLLQNDVVPVATDLLNLPFKPDIIHGLHHLDTMTALVALPDVPAVYHCHGAVWRVAVPVHPRIHRYLAMSHTLAHRIQVEYNLPAEKLGVLLNFVELARFKPRSEPARAVKKALFYNSRHHEDSETVIAVKSACAALDIDLDLVGFHFGVETDEPEMLLPRYDLVFAAGLSAMEALAVGCAVIVLGRSGCGELVTSENFDRYRSTNFSIATNSAPPTVAAIQDEIRRFHPEDCAAVSLRLREVADSDKAIGELVDMYTSVIEAHKQTAHDQKAENEAMHHYLRWIVPLIKQTDQMLGNVWSSSARSQSFEEMDTRLIMLEKEVRRLGGER
jgi:hypothetical protein